MYQHKIHYHIYTLQTVQEQKTPYTGKGKLCVFFYQNARKKIRKVWNSCPHCTVIKQSRVNEGGFDTLRLKFNSIYENCSNKRHSMCKWFTYWVFLLHSPPSKIIWVWSTYIWHKKVSHQVAFCCLHFIGRYSMWER